MKYNISVKDQDFEIEIGEISQGTARVTVNGHDFDVRMDNYPDIKAPAAAERRPPVTVAPPGSSPRIRTQPSAQEPISCGNAIKAPIPGLIMDVKVKVGDPVKIGQTVIIMEAMKMENRITAAVSGTVTEVLVQKGTEVMTGTVLLIIN